MKIKYMDKNKTNSLSSETYKMIENETIENKLQKKPRKQTNKFKKTLNT